MSIVREAVPADAEAIAKIHVQTWQYAYRGLIPDDYLNHLSLEKRLAQRLRILNHPAPLHRTFVAETQGEITGFCDLGPSGEGDADPETGELLALYVAPHRERTGVGTALMAKALETLRGDGFRRAILWVLTDNVPARRFYEKTGWSTEGVAKTEACGTSTLEEIRYAREIAPDAAPLPPNNGRTSPARGA